MAENIKVKSKRNGKIELMRFVFAIVIACFHLNMGIFSSGMLAVEFFFIVTGYLLAKSLSKYNHAKSDNGGGYCRNKPEFCAEKI